MRKHIFVGLIWAGIREALPQIFALVPAAPGGGALSAPVLAKAYDGARLTVLNQWEDWYVVRFDGLVGWASADFITLI